MSDIWPPRAIPTALCLCLAALGVFLAWWLGDLDSLDAWTPNIVVGLVVLAATITFVEWIVQRLSNGYLGEPAADTTSRRACP